MGYEMTALAILKLICIMMVVMGINLKFQEAQGKRHVMTANDLFSTEQYDSLVIEDIQQIDSLYTTY